MIYELRVYEAAPGKFPALLARLHNHALKYFERHGITVVGIWTTVIGDSSTELTYMVAFESLADREKKWGALGADADWQAAKKESEKDGVLTVRIKNQILAPTPFSPAK